MPLTLSCSLVRHRRSGRDTRFLCAGLGLRSTRLPPTACLTTRRHAALLALAALPARATHRLHLPALTTLVDGCCLPRATPLHTHTTAPRHHLTTYLYYLRLDGWLPALQVSYTAHRCAATATLAAGWFGCLRITAVLAHRATATARTTPTPPSRTHLHYATDGSTAYVAHRLSCHLFTPTAGWRMRARSSTRFCGHNTLRVG